jgi:hypothetical protein
MIGTNFKGVSHSGWDIAFWFAVLSPIIGVLLGFLAPFLIYH